MNSRKCLQLLLGVPSVFALACGSAPAEAPAPAETTGGSEFRAPSDSMQVSGLYGTIPETKILHTLEPRLPSFQRCFARAADRLEFIAGKIEFYFRVALDGTVEWVYPRTSTIGDRDTERCLLEVANGARFPEPKGGGPAELSWGFEFEPASGKPPLAWEAAEVGPIVEAEHESLAACDAASLQVTAYVAPGGQVLAAGGAGKARATSEKIDCVLERVRGWTLPDPGAYPAKVTFTLP